MLSDDSFITRLEVLNQAASLLRQTRHSDARLCYERILSFGVDDFIDVYAMANFALLLYDDSCGLSDEVRFEKVYSLSTIALNRINELCEFVSRFFPDDDERDWTERLRVYLGGSLFQLNRFEEALWSLTEAIQSSPTNIAAFSHRALAFSALGHVADALKDLDVAETITREVPFEELTEFSQAAIENIPLIRSMALAVRDMAQEPSPDPTSITDEERIESLSLSYVSPLMVEARDAGLVSWTTREKLDPDFVRMAERELRRHVEGVYLRAVGQNRSVMTDLGRFRSELDALIECYVDQSVDSSIMNFSTSAVRETGYGPEMLALRYSDAFKSYSFAGNFGFSSMATVFPDERMLESVSAMSDGSIVICYHVIPPVDYSPSDVVVRWLISNGRIIHCDSIHCSSLRRSSSRLLREWLLRSVEEEENDMLPPVEVSSEEQIQNCCVLYDLLLAGLESLIPPNTTHITFVPDGLLFRVPFNCLMDKTTGEYLIEEYSISVSCSLWMMQKNKLRQREKDRSPASPSLIHTLICESRASLPDDEDVMDRWRRERRSFQREVNRAILANNRACSGNSASSVIVTLRNDAFSPFLFSSICSRFSPRIVHVVSHGSAIDPSSVRKSFESDLLYEFDMKGALLCSNGKCLLARTVAEEIDLSCTDLVYLSCCSLGDGDLLSGGSLLGFYRACFVAGCPSVICSLWPVLSDISTRLSVLFYRLLNREKGSKAEALRLAVIELLTHGNWMKKREGKSLRDCPSLWASFQLFGHRV